MNRIKFNTVTLNERKEINQSSECFVDCIDQANMKKQKLLTNTFAISHQLKVNYQVLPIKDQYILKNTKNTALIDKNIYELLEKFEQNKMPKELLETLYQLEFLVDANY